MKIEIPTDEQIREELKKTIDAEPRLKNCASCMYYKALTGHCEKINKSFLAYMYGCKFHMTNEEKLIAEARENLISQAKELQKIEFLLAMSLEVSGSASLFIEDMERRMKKVYSREKADAKKKKGGEHKSSLKKDLDMADQMKGAWANIYGHLEKIESQYRMYIQPHLDKIFRKNGVYNDVAYDQFNCDAGMFCKHDIYLARAIHRNPENGEKIYQFIKSLENNNVESEDIRFCLDESDIEHYEMKL